MAAHARIGYRHTGVILVRATTRPGELVPGDMDLFGDASVERGFAWLAQVWERNEVREALQLASPVLSRQICQTLAGQPDGRQIRRIVVSLASYLLRWQGRATPFGLFAGVAACRIGEEPRVRWGQRHEVTARADAAWLAALIRRLEQHPGLLERLPVVVNNAAFVRGDRLVIPGQPGDRLGDIAPLEVSVRYTRPVRDALQAARDPCRFGELAAKLTAGYPAVAPEQIHALLTELVTQHALLTALHTPMTVLDALSHVCAQLQAAGADDLSGLAGLPTQLLAIHDDLSRLEFAPSAAAGMPSTATVASRMRAVCDAAEQPLIIDITLDCDIAVPGPVIREAEAAASTLLRLTPYPFGHPHWKDYHVRFKNRYGTGAVVPVCDLVQADTGLGLPASYLGSPHAPAAPRITPRDDTLLALVQQAVMDRRKEIVLTEPVIQALTVGDPAERLLPPRAELAFEIHAPSCEAMAGGAFRLVVTGTPRPGSSMAGRFADLLPAAERARLADTYRALSTDDVNAVTAQLSFPARRRHSENVARTPQLLDQVISLSEHREPHEDQIGLHDLAVSADARELYLVQLSTGRRIEPRVLHALEARVLTPPLARFLAEVTTARCATYTGFDWGAAARLPYLPRVRSGRAVLCPARWLLTAADLPAHKTVWPEWESALEAWRLRLRAPAAVVLCQNELRLPLNLDHRLHRALLRARLDRAREVELREAPSPADLAWADRACEFLLPLRLASPRAAGERRTTVPLPRVVERSAGHLPGISSWLHAQLHGHPDRQDEILTGHLPRLFDAWDGPPLWWYSRHREVTRPEDDQHLDLYLRLPAPGNYGHAAAQVGQWAADLRDCGLVPHLQLCTYHPETGRYGHGAAMAAAEDTFAADSAAALAQIATAARTCTPAQALTVASLVDLASSYADTPSAGLRWLIRKLPQATGALDRPLRETALALADPRRGWAALRALPGGENVLAAWQLRRDALVIYRTRLARQRDPYPVLRSLLHLHHMRSLAVSPEHERVSNRLARAAALGQVARAPGESQ
jgi:thiopeptide-type bacteriocin biosynthesis protein